MRSGAHIKAGGIVNRLVNGGDFSVGEAVLKRVELPHRHRRGPGKEDLGGLRKILRRRIDVPDSGEQPCNGRHRGHHTAGEALLDRGLLIDRQRPVVPTIKLELLSDAHQLIDDIGPIPPDRLLRRPGPRMQGCSGLTGCPVTDLVEHAPRNLQ